MDDFVNAQRFVDPIAFLSPPWRELFQTDEERRHGFDAAVAEYEALGPAYRRHGYEVVVLPRASVAERVSFVLATLASDRRDSGASRSGVASSS